MRKTDKLSDEEWALAHEAVQRALDALVEFRRQEGIALEKKFREKIANISRLLTEVEPYEQERVGRIMRDVIAKLGEKKVETFIRDANEFVDVFSEAVSAAE